MKVNGRFWGYVSVVLLSSCALVPQQANIAPKVNVATSSEGKNATISIKVVDERPTKSLGRRGSAYGPAAEITSANDISTVVMQQVSNGLRQKGFNVIDHQEGKAAALTVEIRFLEYSTSTGLVTGGVNVDAALKAIAVRGTQSYEQMYRTESKNDVLVVPTAETNEEWINAALGDVLNQLLSDSALIKILASE